MTNEELRKRPDGDFRIYEEEVSGIVDLKWEPEIEAYECPHFPSEDGRWERGWMRLEKHDPILGEQTRAFAMCYECYCKLRQRGVATSSGMWERLSMGGPSPAT